MCWLGATCRQSGIAAFTSANEAGARALAAGLTVSFSGLHYFPVLNGVGLIGASNNRIGRTFLRWRCRFVRPKMSPKQSSGYSVLHGRISRHGEWKRHAHSEHSAQP